MPSAAAGSDAQPRRTTLHLHLVSDSTGETLEALARAALAQFEGVDAVKHFWPMVRTEGHMNRVMDEIGGLPGLVLYTVVAPAVRALLESRAATLGLPVIAVLDPLTIGLSRVLGREASTKPGRRHAMDAEYFRRVDAIHFAMDHDDGQNVDGWNEADILLVGVSRSSKTPTSIYLANRGLRVANWPLVAGRPLPRIEADRLLVVGLTVSPERLVQIRRNRLLGQGYTAETDYADFARVAEEVASARRLFAERSWPVIDVTRRSIEETAAAVIRLYQERAGPVGARIAEQAPADGWTAPARGPR